MFCRISFSGFLFKDPKYQQGCVEAKINAPEPGKSSIKNDSTLPEAEKEFSLTVKAGEEPGPEPGPKPEPGPGPEPSAEIQTDSTLPEAKPDEEFDSCIIKIY